MALNINGTTGISGVDGSVSAPAVTGTDSNTGITFPSADTIKFSTGGVERMQITNSGVSGTGVGGKILQVVSAVITTQVDSSSSSHVDTGLSCSITTTTNSSKVFVTVSQAIYCRNPGGTTYSRAGISYDLVRDSTVIQNGVDNILLWGATYSPYIVTAQMAAIVHLDTPGNAGTYTYKTTGATTDGNWKAQDNNSPSSMVLMEIAA